jgi:hypothetical protein
MRGLSGGSYLDETAAHRADPVDQVIALLAQRKAGFILAFLRAPVLWDRFYVFVYAAV